MDAKIKETLQLLRKRERQASKEVKTEATRRVKHLIWRIQNKLI